MKIKTLLLLLLAAQLPCYAVTRTVNNNGFGAQYFDLESAYQASSNGDTLMVMGSSVNYFLSSASWNKNIVVIGSGYNSDKQLFQDVKLHHTISGSNYFYIGQSSKFLGIRFVNYVNLSADVNGLDFEACKFDFDFWTNSKVISNLKFINCVFSNGGSNYKSDLDAANFVYFSHCVFSGILTGSNNNFNSDISFDHCIFLRSGSSFTNMYNAEINNSIFLGNTPITSIYNSSFNNNIARVDVANAWATNGNSSSNNLDSINPLFVNVPINVAYNTTMDFNLQPGSPAIGFAIDGGNIGVHDANSTFNEEGEAQNIPVIRKMNMVNPNVPQNGNVNVKVRSTKAREN